MTGRVRDLKSLIRVMVEGQGKKVSEDLLREQAAAAESIMALGREDGGILVINAPTASGKTLAYIAPFVYSIINESPPTFPRMYIVLPTQALIDDQRDKITVYLRSALSAAGMHGPIADSLVGVDYGGLGTDTYLYTAPLTLTTVDSFFYGFAATRVRRWLTGTGVEKGYYTFPTGLLASSLVVLDEAHLIQDEFFLSPRVISMVVAALAAAGATVVLSTATLGDYLVKRIREEAGLLGLNVNMVKYNAAVSRRIKVLYFNDYDLRTVATSDIKEHVLGSDEKVLVVTNTVGRAQEMYNALKESLDEEECRVYLIHSRFKASHKRGRIRDIREALNSEGCVVVVSTQVLEAGVDLNFTRLYTEVAPVDALIQRIGRVGRHSGRGLAVIAPPCVPQGEAGAGENGDACHLPYHRDVYMNTVEVLKGDVGRLEKAIGDVAAAGQVINSVYTPEVTEKIESNGMLLLAKTMTHLEVLTGLTYPPEHAVLRPSTYLDLVLTQRGSELCNRLEGVTTKLGRERTVGCVDIPISTLDPIRLSVSPTDAAGARSVVERLLKSVGENEDVRVFIIRAGRRPAAGCLEAVKVTRGSAQTAGRPEEIVAVVACMDESVMGKIYDNERGLLI